MCVNFLFVDQQNQGSLNHTRCIIPGQHAQLQLQSKCTTSVQHAQPIHFKCTIPVQHAQLQARCTISSQDKLSHLICIILDEDDQSSPNVTPYVRKSSSNPFQASKSTFIHSYTQKHNFTLVTPHQSGSITQKPGAHQNSSSSNPNPRQKKTKVVTLETLKASKNVSRYMKAIRHGGSQSSMYGPRK